MTWLFSYWRWGLAGLAALALLWAGSYVRGKFEDAARVAPLERQLKTANDDLKAEREAHAATEAARVEMSKDLEGARNDVRKAVDDAKKQIPRVVVDRRDCDIGVDALRLLNRARGYEEAVPDAAGRAPPAAGRAGENP